MPRHAKMLSHPIARVSNFWLGLSWYSRGGDTSEFAGARPLQSMQEVYSVPAFAVRVRFCKWPAVGAASSLVAVPLPLRRSQERSKHNVLAHHGYQSFHRRKFNCFTSTLACSYFCGMAYRSNTASSALPLLAQRLPASCRACAS